MTYNTATFALALAGDKAYRGLTASCLKSLYNLARSRWRRNNLTMGICSHWCRCSSHNARRLASCAIQLLRIVPLAGEGLSHVWVFSGVSFEIVSLGHESKPRRSSDFEERCAAMC